jgi:hypothetical protein
VNRLFAYSGCLDVINRGTESGSPGMRTATTEGCRLAKKAMMRALHFHPAIKDPSNDGLFSSGAPGLKNLELRSARPRAEWLRFMLIHECDQFLCSAMLISRKAESGRPRRRSGRGRGILPPVFSEPLPSPYLVLSQWMRTVSGATDVNASPPCKTGHSRRCMSE